MKLKFLLVCLPLLAAGAPSPGTGASALSAPPGRLAFQSYGAPQGLGNLNIWSLEQDQDGFIWVGTADGLFRYDGAHFQGFGIQDGLPSAKVRAICPESRDRLWIGTVKGLAVRERGVITPLRAAQGLPEAEVFALARDPGGALWVATEEGFFRQKGVGLAFEGAPGWPRGALARALWMDGTSLFVTQQAHLLRYDLHNPTAPHEVAGPWRERLESLARDGQGRFWVRSRSGLWMRPREDAPFQDFSQRVGAATYDGYLRVTPRGDLLIPTGDDLTRVHGDHWESISAAVGLPTPWTNRAMEDREGSLWVGGLALHRDLAHEAWRQHTKAEGLAGGVAWSLARDRGGHLWAGTSSGLVQAVNGTWKPVPETRRQAILALVQAPDGALWMGGAPGRLRRWVPGTSLWKEFATPQSTITALLFGPDGSLWVATRREGLFRVPPGKGQAPEAFRPEGTVPGERILSMCRGGGDRLWMAGTHGLLLQEKGRWRRLGKGDGLLGEDLMAVFERSDGEVWISYQDRPGLSRFAYAAGRLVLQEHLDAGRGFPPGKVYYVREDALGRLWAGTTQGVHMLEGGQWHSFRASDGMPGDDCDGGAFLSDDDGNVWVGTLGGLGHFRADQFGGLPAAPPSFILSAQYGATRLPFPLPARVEIPRKDADVELKFTGLTCLNENQVTHQIRLVGLEEEWRDTTIREARFTRLPPGSYRFEVRAGFRGVGWGPTAAFSFRVLPAWWQTWWFRTLELLAAGGIIAGAVQWRIRILQGRNRELETLVLQRTRALAEANQTLQQLTVTDPLTGLKNRRFLDLTIEEDLAKVNRDYHFLSDGKEGSSQANLDILFLMVDLDHFKRVNDTYGHAAGDQVLQQVRDRLLEAVRDTDTVVRWGGEEFLVVARQSDRSQASVLAQRILDLVRSRPFHVGDDQTLPMTCSLGVAPYPFIPAHPPDAVSWTRVVEVADRCLYAAKESGRNGYVGVLQGGPAPRDVLAFLGTPEACLDRGFGPLVTSFPDPAALQWHKV